MIGNDIVDLDLARKESNWQRKGFLEKIFSLEEQYLIHNDSNPEIMVWNLWSRKEAAYKIFNRNTGISGYFPWRLNCSYEDLNSGTVIVSDFVFHTQTQITDSYVYSIAVSDIGLFNKISVLETLENIKKENRIPYTLDVTSNKMIPVSITHHGRFQKIITLK
ncbi:4'-phosphopantetheinyl transferase family protein [Flavobacterium taihuense]|uniref:4'-phosphopantetheinyl transferase superfamily protein n=1 Tax=Flavobacterium taihuense TaxID=2857508 RepID=A0ABS6XYN8_9FLAO|nr:4'-phosphopantetheinyl transferase superfamily protein [Flavobacterium taihuense]MBW4361782.1 4'-phosphopantetheinyl transferase superfamily protein [Flavobacterium taihuense]